MFEVHLRRLVVFFAAHFPRDDFALEKSAAVLRNGFGTEFQTDFAADACVTSADAGVGGNLKKIIIKNEK